MGAGGLAATAPWYHRKREPPWSVTRPRLFRGERPGRGLEDGVERRGDERADALVGRGVEVTVVDEVLGMRKQGGPRVDDRDAQVGTQLTHHVVVLEVPRHRTAAEDRGDALVGHQDAVGG